MKGSLVPLVTPFDGGAVDDRRFADLIEWQIDSGSHGLVVGGTTGEPGARQVGGRVGLAQVARCHGVCPTPV
ncbi:MAG: dihydrodipicolinate synthase family protein [bacterium]